MPPVRMIDVLRKAETFHGQLSRRFAQESEHASREEVKVLLNFISRHEALLKQAMLDYESGASEAVLEQYLEATPDFSCLVNPDALEIDKDATPDQIIDTALQLDDCLIALYRELEREAVNPELKDALDSLLALELEEEVQLMRSTLTG